MAKAKRFFTAKNIAYLAVLLALVIVLQTCGGFFQVGGLSLSFVLVPIVLGGILLGVWAGAFLGFVFGFIVLMYGVAGAEPFTATLLANSPVMTVLICLVKGTAAGLVSALLYKLISKKSAFAASVIASVSAPIVNTGLFIVGCLMISGTIGTLFTTTGSLSEIVYFLFIGCAGINFLVEFTINFALAPAIYRVTAVAERAYGRKQGTAGTLLEIFFTASILLAAALSLITAVLIFILLPSLWWLGTLLVVLAAACAVLYALFWRRSVRSAKKEG